MQMTPPSGLPLIHRARLWRASLDFVLIEWPRLAQRWLRSKMSDQELPRDVEELVRRHIHSVAQIEALLFFHERPGERWDVVTLSKRLYAGKVEMAQALELLKRDGFLEGGPALYEYGPRPELRAVVEALRAAYSRYLIPITSIIHDKPRRIQAFSDAFRIRED